jgi:hypothetical protein
MATAGAVRTIAFATFRPRNTTPRDVLDIKPVTPFGVSLPRRSRPQTVPAAFRARRRVKDAVARLIGAATIAARATKSRARRASFITAHDNSVARDHA